MKLFNYLYFIIFLSKYIYSFKINQKSSISNFKLNNIQEKKCFYPTDIAKLYNYPIKKYSGKNQNIATIIFNCAYDLNNIKNDVKKSFQNQNIIGNLNINLINYNNASLFNPDGYNELAMDVQIISSIAPNAKINIYNFDYNGNEEEFYNNLHDVIKLAINDGSNIISLSFGSAENNKTYDKLDKLFEYAANNNINIYVSAGNTAATDGYDDLTVEYPASNPNVISCGGTMINNKSEVVWNNYNYRGTGGGFSKLYKKPSYQKLINNKMRGIPDISGYAVRDYDDNGDPNTGYYIYVNNTIQLNSGTSAVAPLMAGLNGLLNEANDGRSIGFLNNIIYNNPSVCIDITQGDNYPTNEINDKTNVGYNATTGWDPCSGLGRVDGEKLLNVVLKLRFYYLIIKYAPLLKFFNIKKFIPILVAIYNKI